MHITTAVTATSSMNLPPQIILLSTSLPYRSVPIGNCLLGGELGGPTSKAVGLLGDMYGARIDIAVMNEIMASPAIMKFLPLPLLTADFKGLKRIPEIEKTSWSELLFFNISPLGQGMHIAHPQSGLPVK